jgi:hypothetical protein
MVLVVDDKNTQGCRGKAMSVRDVGIGDGLLKVRPGCLPPVELQWPSIGFL